MLSLFVTQTLMWCGDIWKAVWPEVVLDVWGCSCRQRRREPNTKSQTVCHVQQNYTSSCLQNYERYDCMHTVQYIWIYMHKSIYIFLYLCIETYARCCVSLHWLHCLWFQCLLPRYSHETIQPAHTWPWSSVLGWLRGWSRLLSAEFHHCGDKKREEKAQSQKKCPKMSVGYQGKKKKRFKLTFTATNAETMSHILCIWMSRQQKPKTVVLVKC